MHLRLMHLKHKGLAIEIKELFCNLDKGLILSDAKSSKSPPPR